MYTKGDAPYGFQKPDRRNKDSNQPYLEILQELLNQKRFKTNEVNYRSNQFQLNIGRVCERTFTEPSFRRGVHWVSWNHSWVSFAMGGLLSYFHDRPPMSPSSPLPVTTIPLPEQCNNLPPTDTNIPLCVSSSRFLSSSISYSDTLTSEPLAIPNKPPLMGEAKRS